MAFSTTSFFAGVGTMLTAVTIGFVGGSMITSSSSRIEPNRLERVAMAAAPITPAVPDKADNLRVSKQTNETPPPDRVIALTPPPTAQQPAQMIPIAQQEDAPPMQSVDKRDAANANEGARKAHESDKRETDLKRTARRAELRSERRKRRGIEAAVNAVRQLQQDNRLQEVSQRDDSPRIGFLGND